MIELKLTEEHAVRHVNQSFRESGVRRGMDCVKRVVNMEAVSARQNELVGRNKEWYGILTLLGVVRSMDIHGDSTLDEYIARTTQDRVSRELTRFDMETVKELCERWLGVIGDFERSV